MTDGIELSKLRKSILRINFLKFTYFMRYNEGCTKNVSATHSSKLQVFIRVRMKTIELAIAEG